jgi:hypothetical protein
MFNKKANRISILCHEQRNAISTPKSKTKCKRNHKINQNQCTKKLNGENTYPSGTQSWMRRVSDPMPASPWSSLPFAISLSTWWVHWRNNCPYGGVAIATEQMASVEGEAEQVASEEGASEERVAM